MTTATRAWKRLPNLSSESAGSIHDDEMARSLGFRGGFVGGSILLAAMADDLLHAAGPQFLKDGTLAVRFRVPLYASDEVQVVSDASRPARFPFTVSLVTRDGRTCCDARAGLGDGEGAWPPDYPTDSGAFPADTLDTNIYEGPFTFDARALDQRLELAPYNSEWYRGESPLSRGVYPSFLFLLAGASYFRGLPADASVKASGINSAFWLQNVEPAFRHLQYSIAVKLVNKGVTRSGWFRTLAMTLRSEDRVILRAKQRVVWPRVDRP
jgi:hypothetical protein